MNVYISFSLALLAVVSLIVVVPDFEDDILALEGYLRLVVVGFYKHLIASREIFYPASPAALTWVDPEGKFYLNKKTVDEILSKRFYAKGSVVQPGFYRIVLTGYSSTVAQCGPDPFITASGQRVRRGIVATNFLPFGSKIKIPEVFGEKVFEVQDRMAQRYWGRIDVWFPNYTEAARFGVKKLNVEVLP